MINKGKAAPQKEKEFRRADNRPDDEIRRLRIVPDYLDFADGSAYIGMGMTRVVAAASVEERVPPFLKGTGTGWITAEYAMLPRSTEKRTQRERTQGRISGRSQEIQRLIGRALRAVTDLTGFGETTIIIDCDVIQADGGTRSAAVTAGCVALGLAFKKMLDVHYIDRIPLKHLVAGVSVGLSHGRLLLDLDYSEDSEADIDMNVVETDQGELVEVQAAGEKNPFSRKDFTNLMRLADKGIAQVIETQRDVLKKKHVLFMAYG